ncbi:MAG: FAD-binding protein [Alphaproteobacteria bacterium]|nr:FAD-binding protein [Alphaproteobacteria bacterium]
MSAAGVSWDETTDVVVVGFGAAGAVAAIEARRNGAETLLLEKMPWPGGLSIVSAGGVRVTDNVEQAYQYLVTTCAGRTPLPILRALAEGMIRAPDYLRELANAVGATVKVTKALGNYPFPGTDALAYCEIDQVPALADANGYHAVQGIKGGTRLFKVLEDNVHALGVQVRMEVAAERLITDESGAIAGIAVRAGGRSLRIRTRRGVVLACGGFEDDAEMKRQYLQAMPVLTGSFRGNTGDGIRMAQAVGADLWHMWHYHGPYGLKHPDPAFPFGFYMKAVPMWTPGRPGRVSDLGVTDAHGKPMSQKTLAKMAWIVVDQTGRRFMDEYPPYPGDTGIRPFDWYDSKTQRFPRIPAYVIFDEEGRKMYPVARSVQNDRDFRYAWSPDNLKEVENGILERAESLDELAAKMEVDAAALRQTIERWNRMVDAGRDEDFGRMPETLTPIRTPPYYFGRAYPIVINTQGGPVHDVEQRILNPFGEPIPRLYAAGECGSVFGHLYLGGGNLSECLVGGWTAGRNVASLPPGA